MSSLELLRKKGTQTRHTKKHTMIEILTFINHLKELQKLDKEDVQKAIDKTIEHYEKIEDDNDNQYNRIEDPKIFN